MNNLWVNTNERLPEQTKRPVLYIVKWYDDKMYVRTMTANQLADVAKRNLIDYLWLDEQATTPVNEDAHEKEIMMQAFCKVQQLFEGREWIMQGRGSYPYNDDRYKEEVRYLYDEFEAVRKDTWGNIKSKSADYRKCIIDEYINENITLTKGEAVAFAEWIEQEGYYQRKSDKKWFHWFGTIVAETTAQLHELWQQSKNKQ